MVNGYVLDGWNFSIMVLFGSGPKLTIKCGECKRVYEKRVAPSHRPVVYCLHCGQANKLDVTIE